MRQIPSVPSNEISAPPIPAVQPKASVKPIVSTPPMSSAKSGIPSLSSIENSFQPIPLCNQCGEPIDSNGKCTSCESKSSPVKPAAKPGTPGRTAPGMAKLSSSNSAPLPAAPKKPATSDKLLYDEDSIIELLVESEGSDKAQPKQAAPSTKPPVKAKIKPPPIPSGGAAQVKLIPGKPLEPSKSEPEDDSAFWEAVGQD